MLMRRLRDRGVENVLAAQPGSRSEAVAGELGFDCFTTSMRGYTDLGAVRRLARIAREVAPDIVHLHTGRSTWLGGLASWRCGLPALTTRRMDRRVRRGLRTKLIYRRLVQRAVAIAPAVADQLLKAGVPAAKIAVIWDAVEPESLRQSHDDGGAARSALRAELGAGPDDLVLLTMAALNRRKGLDVLLDALAACEAQGLRPKAWLCGTGGLRAELQAQIDRLGVDATLLGWREDVRELLHAADLCLLPSRREGVGVAALEAMAAGKPVIASKVGGLGQAMEHGESGFFVPPDDIPALAAAIQRLADDPGLCAQLGAGAAKRVDERYAADLQAEAYLNLYGEVIGEARAAGA